MAASCGGEMSVFIMAAAYERAVEDFQRVWKYESDEDCNRRCAFPVGLDWDEFVRRSELVSSGSTR